MTKPNASSCVHAAERAASLTERTAQLEATLCDPDADDVERRHAAESLARLAAVAVDERIPPDDDDVSNNVESPELHNAMAAVADLHRRIADRLDPQPAPADERPDDQPTT